jgi:hypothetical protein
VGLGELRTNPVVSCITMCSFRLTRVSPDFLPMPARMLECGPRDVEVG